MVVFGRPKGDPCGICEAARGSYQQWKEDNIPTQVVFEILSPSNTATEMSRKLLFYQQYGVEEYYIYDPERNELVGSQRVDQHLVEIPEIQEWVSPRLGVRFVVDDTTLNLYAPNGDRFLTPVELASQRDHERQRADELEEMLQRYRDRFGELK